MVVILIRSSPYPNVVFPVKENGSLFDGVRAKLIVAWVWPGGQSRKERLPDQRKSTNKQIV
jgi:hypothetical protein